MIKLNSWNWRGAWSVLAVALLSFGSARAQDPSSVDIDLVQNTNPTTLEVRVRPNGQGFGDVVSNLTFTIRWATGTTTALGTRTGPCPGALPTPTAQVTNPSFLGVPTGFNYRTYNLVMLSLLDDEGCPWPADEWTTIMTVPVTNVGAGCTTFQIVSDDWTGANNRNYFCSLGGINKTGIIEPTAVNIGSCTADCLGVIGGPALPGTACNDNNACTTGDVWSASCVCAGTIQDTDGDGVCDANDNCPTLAGQQGDACNDNNACTINDVITAACVCAGTVLDTDGDGVCDANDNCPTLAGQQGDACNDNNACTTNDVITAACVCAGTVADADGDGICDANDNCPNLAGQQGDACNDNDACTINDVITAACVCAGTVLDTDGDGTCDANDPCPFLANLVNGDPCDDGNAGTVNDVVVNCVCAGTLPNDCNGVPGGPAQPGTTCDDNNVCTVNDVYSASCVCAGTLADTDNDGVCDANDNCPTLAGQQGDACNDNNACTTNDVITAACVCAGTFADADSDGICDADDNCPNLAGEQGDACNDNNACTSNDVITAACVCAGTVVDTDGDGVCDANDNCPTLAGQQGDACNDNNVCTTNDVITAACVCAGTVADADGDGLCDANDNCPNLAGVQGDACDDGNGATINDVIGANCVCAGTLLGNDCLGVPGGPAQPGTACDDGNATTVNDLWSASCVCVGTPLPLDCNGVPGGPAVPGTSCNDNSVCTENDTWTANCTCEGTAISCDDNNPCTIDACNPVTGCVFTPVPDSDGDGLCDVTDNCPNLSGVQGDACDDGNQNTINDVINALCQCVGQPVGGCTENLTLSVKLDGNPTENTWELWDATETTILQSGGFSAGQANTTVNVPICVPQGCYHLRVLDSGNNGITGGGYVLRNAQNRRIIDASLGSFTSVSEINQNSNRNFCVPIGAINMLSVSCDASRLRTSPVYCNAQPGATGYQFWIYDAHGTYNRRVVTAGPSMVPSTLNTNPVPLNVDLNVRARVALNNVFGEFGAACRIRFVQASNFGTRDMEEGDVMEVVVPSMSIYPNPNRDGQLTVNMDGLYVEDGTTLDIDVYDMLGKRVHAERATAADGRMLRTMDLSNNLPAGIYMVNVTVEGQLFTQRLVMQ